MNAHPYAQHSDQCYTGLYRFAAAIVYGEDISELSTSRLLVRANELIEKLLAKQPRSRSSTIRFSTTLVYAGEEPAIRADIEVDNITETGFIIFRLLDRKIVIESSGIELNESSLKSNSWAMSISEFASKLPSFEALSMPIKCLFKEIANQEQYRGHKVIFNHDKGSGYLKIFDAQELVVDIKY